MINNRQAGRRRGRGGQRSQGNNPGRPDNGNRIDNRARGNAAQLLEKYKSLARDAQMQGDRVNTEYYLQFADHYFRVLNENRARFEENQARRGAPEAFDGDDDEEFDGENYADDRVDGERAAQANGNRRDNGARDNGYRDQPYRDQGDPDREARRDNGRDNGLGQFRDRPRESYRPPLREPSRDAGDKGDAPEGSGDHDAPAAAAITDQAPRRGRPRRAAVVDEGATAFDADRLPPALGITAGGEEEDAAPKPRRRRSRAPESDTTQAG